jgi:ureidoacrylate peracid hydrolase
VSSDLIQQEWERAEEFIKKTGRPEPLFKADKSNTALVVIDMQNAFVAPGSTIEVPKGREIVPNINALARACRKAGIPVIWVVSKFRSETEWGLITAFEPDSPVGTEREKPMNELKWGAKGTNIWRELEVDGRRDHEVVKCRYSAFVSGSSNLERLLRILGRNHLIMTGVATNVCVGSSAMDAMMLDFKVTFVSDATAAFTDFLQQSFLINLKMVFADVATTAELMKQLEEI